MCSRLNSTEAKELHRRCDSWFRWWTSCSLHRCGLGSGKAALSSFLLRTTPCLETLRSTACGSEVFPEQTCDSDQAAILSLGQCADERVNSASSAPCRISLKSSNRLTWLQRTFRLWQLLSGIWFPRTIRRLRLVQVPRRLARWILCFAAGLMSLHCFTVASGLCFKIAWWCWPILNQMGSFFGSQCFLECCWFCSCFCWQGLYWLFICRQLVGVFQEGIRSNWVMLGLDFLISSIHKWCCCPVSPTPAAKANFRVQVEFTIAAFQVARSPTFCCEIQWDSHFLSNQGSFLCSEIDSG